MAWQQNPRKEPTRTTAAFTERDEEDERISLIIFDTAAFRRAYTRWEAVGETLDTAEAGMKSIVGVMTLEKRGECRGAYEINAAAAKKGYGPLLYDMALTLVYFDEDETPGVIPDRGKVSPAARRVWQHMQEKRTDIRTERTGVLCESHFDPVLDHIYSLTKPYAHYTTLLSRGRKLTLLEQRRLNHFANIFWTCYYSGVCPAGVPAGVIPPGDPQYATANPTRRATNVRHLVCNAR